jgi:CRP-like cAMP-binding protein
MPAFDLLLQAEAMPHRHLRGGDYVYRAGKENDESVFVVVEGVVIEVDANEGFKYGTEIEAGGFFGDIEVMSGSKTRVQSFKVKSLSATLGIMDKRALNLLGGLSPQFFLNLLKSAVDNLTRAEQRLLEQKPSDD